MTPEIASAIKEIEQAVPESTVSLREDAEGGVYVIVDPVDPGPRYAQRETWIGFHVTFQYPYSDVYPHFVRGDLARADGQVLGEGTSATTFEGRPAIQLSRRSNRLNPADDTAALKLIKVLKWLQAK